MNLNRILESLLDEYGLNDILSGLAVQCRRQAQFARDDGDPQLGESWETDAVTLEKTVKMVCVE